MMSTSGSKPCLESKLKAIICLSFSPASSSSALHCLCLDKGALPLPQPEAVPALASVIMHVLGSWDPECSIPVVCHFESSLFTLLLKCLVSCLLLLYDLTVLLCLAWLLGSHSQLLLWLLPTL